MNLKEMCDALAEYSIRQELEEAEASGNPISRKEAEAKVEEYLRELIEQEGLVTNESTL